MVPCVTSLRQRNIDTARSTASANRSISLDGVVRPKRRPDRPRNPKLVHQRFRAVVPCAHRNAELVEQRAQIVRMDALHEEGHHPRLAWRRAVEAQPLNALQLRVGVLRELVLVGRQGRHAHTVHPIQGGPQGNASADVRGACLKLVGKLVVGRALFKTDGANHLPAAAVGRHRVKQGLFAVQNPNARGAVGLVATEHVEIHIQVAHVDGQMRDRLCPVHEHRRSGIVGT